MSKGSFQCGAWPDLSDIQHKRFHSCLLATYRRAAGNYCKVNDTTTSADRALGWQIDVVGDDTLGVAMMVSDLFTDE